MEKHNKIEEVIMALRDQPYIPLYVQDFLTDEKLACCSLSTQGVYIRIICVFHKSETYGGILFKQIPEQILNKGLSKSLANIQINSNQHFNFAYLLSKQIGVSIEDIVDAIEELLFFDVLKMGVRDGVNFLYQKRMIEDYETSLKEDEVNKKNNNFSTFIKENFEFENKDDLNVFSGNKTLVNPEEVKNQTNKLSLKDIRKIIPPTLEMVQEYVNSREVKIDPEVFINHYQARGWKYNGGQKMVDWQAGVRTWEKNNFNFSLNQGGGKAQLTPAERTNQILSKFKH